jgi:hypothetical protein
MPAPKTAKVGGGGLSIDTSHLDAFAARLKAASPQVRSKFRNQLKDAIEMVGNDARARASWSTTIPTAIRTRTSVTNKGVNGYVEVPKGGTGAARVAVLFEFGNSTKRHGYASTGSVMFRHPVFNSKGQKSWGESKTGGQYAEKRQQANGVSNRHGTGKRHGTGWGWANQPTKPFMRPALAAKRDKVIDRIDQVLVDTANDLGRGV